MARLAKELEVYETLKPQWLRKHKGEFVVILGAEPLGFYPDFQAAYCAGVEKYGINTDFLVKRVAAQEPVFVVF